MKKTHYFWLIVLVTTIPIKAQFIEKQENLKSYEGYFNFYYSEDKDEIYLEVDKIDQEFLYVHSLTSGIGSNDIGLDRGQIGDGVIVKFKKAGNKLLLVQPNLNYRAITSNQLERRSVEQAFAQSVLFGFPIKEKRDGKYIIDITSFLIQDTHGVGNRLKALKEGVYSIDASRSALNLERTKAFSKNVEFEALTTFKGNPTGKHVATVAPDSKYITVIQHHSLVKLPDHNYQKRAFEPRCGSFAISYLDYATAVQEPIVKRFITRHRLEKKNPKLSISEAKEPIVYYLDPGTPEPVRSALLEGGRWWNQAFEAIGYKDAFQIKMLPADADPMDLRYNVIQWVHRSTRGWSYGASVIDPRTGEILKGHVSLGSLRIRQDFLIAQALLNRPFKESDDNYKPMLDMALARIRQLSAHEIGHTLGFAHNFAASTNDRASVMDYPHPAISISDDRISLANAYDTNIGAWDKVTVAYSYSTFATRDEEKKKLDQLLDSAYQSGLRFISDYDARARGGAHGSAHLWDNGKNSVEELYNVLKIRNMSIENFSADNIRSGEPYSVLEDVFVPLYFFHRYQTEAAVKSIGGLSYNYAVKGDAQEIVHPIDPKEQQMALTAVLSTLDPKVLKVPEDKLTLFPPRAYGYYRSRESFQGKTGVSFDALSAAETAADMTLRLLLHPERASRLIQQKAIFEDNLGFQDVLDQLQKKVFKLQSKNSYTNGIQEIVKAVTLNHLFQLNNSNVHPQVKAMCSESLKQIRKGLSLHISSKSKASTFNMFLIKQIDDYFKDSSKYKPAVIPTIPDGSPIGDFQCYTRN